MNSALSKDTTFYAWRLVPNYMSISYICRTHVDTSYGDFFFFYRPEGRDIN